MKVLLKIALRNLLEHKTKTLIIGSIIFLGIIVPVMGNSEPGIRKKEKLK